MPETNTTKPETDSSSTSTSPGGVTPGLIEVETLDGVKKMTPAEVSAEFKRSQEKERGADARLREAADMRKETEQERNFIKDWRASNGGDYEALKRLPGYNMGVSQAQVDQLLAQRRAADNGQKSASVNTPVEPESVPVGLEDLDPALRQDVEQLRRDRLSLRRTEIHAQLDSVLDADPVLGDIMKQMTPAQKKRAVEFAQGALRRRVEEARASTRTFGALPTELGQVAIETRSYLADLYGEDVVNPPGATPTPGATRTPTVPSVGRSPLPGSSALHRNTSPPKRVADPRRSEEYSQNIADRLTHMALTQGGDDF